MARSERDRERDRERFRKLGEAIEQMDREFPLPPMSPARRRERIRFLNAERAAIGMPPFPEEDHDAEPAPARNHTRSRTSAR